MSHAWFQLAFAALALIMVVTANAEVQKKCEPQKVTVEERSDIQKRADRIYNQRVHELKVERAYRAIDKFRLIGTL